MMHGIPLMMPRLSVGFGGVCFGAFLGDCWDVFWALAPDCGLGLEFGSVGVVCDVLFDCRLAFCWVWRGVLLRVLGSRGKIFDFRPLVVALALGVGA